MAEKKVRVAIIGVGNCASSLVQGVHFYRDAKDSDRVPGLMHVNLDMVFPLVCCLSTTRTGEAGFLKRRPSLCFAQRRGQYGRRPCWKGPAFQVLQRWDGAQATSC